MTRLQLRPIEAVGIVGSLIDPTPIVAIMTVLTDTLRDDGKVENRYSSFADVSQGNHVKFHVAGCAYFWAISDALLRAKESVWIMGWWVSPEVYLRRPPSENEEYRLDRMLQAAAFRGVKVNVVVFKEVAVAMCLDSHYTKRTLEALHPGISVFRYPDHIPGEGVRLSQIGSHSARGDAGIRKIGDEALQGLFEGAGLRTLFWAHHEKLVIVDQQLAFIGGIDLSYGRWDLVQHPIADSHPGNPRQIVFPGQDYNNALLKDYEDLNHWEKTGLDRSTRPRMGWEDISVSLTGPAVVDICQHFVDRWNFIWEVKYSRAPPAICGYGPLLQPRPFVPVSHGSAGSMDCQIVRSVGRWSNGIQTENSLYHAYIDIIARSEHFVYLEQQFFITSTGDEVETIWNRVAEAFVARILRAAREKKRYKVIVVLPALPAFPGDIHALFSGELPRALMKLQFDSINRGGFSIFDRLKEAGVSPDDYIRFFNLRSYDRLRPVTSYRVEDLLYPLGCHANIEIGAPKAPDAAADMQTPCENQQSSEPSFWDTVSSCYMLDGPDIRSAHWPDGASFPEVEGFVQEQVYVHSKLLIADDKVVLCGSANLNDRSLKGSRDSEIAVVVEDRTPLPSTMHDQPFEASKFAATLRRYLFRKHLGLLYPQNMRRPDGLFMPAPVPIDYDYGSPEDLLVADPLSDGFLDLWGQVARRNTLAFRRVFEAFPDDKEKTWEDYDSVIQKARRGHVAYDNFSSGKEATPEVKNELSAIKGTLVEMPMDFLINCNIQPDDAAFNMYTRPGYT
ncbi:hypothetical protein BDW66DRAFT_154355 [Aspergillus desertorum]